MVNLLKVAAVAVCLVISAQSVAQNAVKIEHSIVFCDGCGGDHGDNDRERK